MEITTNPMEVVRRWTTISGPQLTPDQILESVSAITGIDEGDIMGKHRPRQVVKARHLFWAMLRRMSGMSYPQIARYADCNHSSVLMAIRNIPTDVLDAMEEVTSAHLNPTRSSVEITQTASAE